ncbi:homoserine/homoserine lactone efflux protein [Chitinivorax tropicus]|uniref:Homoserine/homoserine lactone efflux protein n=1 Tax=Chitinivorax tropicus TaxID=714531 RepID=A0A840MM25_9PROT|nr:homoserine/homoserine lactone efflux protein [Chitinivorax tropicus]MBB5017967.1 homoserine/homoserine lactone efflux protein [Chitinivorax tropicus]
MTLQTWLAFFVACWLISLSPGAGAIKAMSTGMRYGYRKGLYNILGLQLGVLFLIAIVAIGLGALLAASTLAFNVIKWFGVVYLIWLGIQQWRAEATPMVFESDHGASPRQLILEGFLVNASNPKGIIFMLAVLPQFINPHAPQLPQYLICAASLTFTDLVVMSGYTLLASKVLSALREAHHVKWLNRTFGALFIGAGALLAAFKRSA